MANHKDNTCLKCNNMENEIIKRFDEIFISPKTLWAQDKSGKWYGKEDIKQFIISELKALKKEVLIDSFFYNEDYMRIREAFEKRGI